MAPENDKNRRETNEFQLQALAQKCKQINFKAPPSGHLNALGRRHREPSADSSASELKMDEHLAEQSQG